MLNDPEQLWEQFFVKYNLSQLKQRQFRDYYSLLSAANKLHNITAITDLSSVITHHFVDSLALDPYIRWDSLAGFSDIGTGGGFPALPLKILHPEVPLILIEVNEKKGAFLQGVIEHLELELVTISQLDWRTFLRKTDYEIDLFTARASLKPDELIRLFMPSSPYKNAQLVYWASQGWSPSSQVEQYIVATHQYHVEDIPRKLIFLRGGLSAQEVLV